MKKSAVLFLACAAALASLGRAQEEIKIGEYASLTGGQASFGISTNNATLLGAEEINKAGGVLGRPIKLIVEDNRSLPGESATIVHKLIASDKVVAIMGEFASSRSLEGGPICQEKKIPMLSSGSTNPKVTQIGNYIFRSCFTDAFQGAVMARFALKKGFQNAAVLTDQKQAYSKGLAEEFIKVFTAGGGRIVKQQSYSSGDKDFRTQLTSIKLAKPDMIFIPGYYNEVALIAKQARQQGVKAVMMGGDGWEGGAILDIAGKDLEGCYYSSHFSPDNPDPQIQDFIKNYKAKYGVVPDCQAALGYDSIRIMAEAIARAGNTDPKAIRDALAQTRDFKGVTGIITIDADRNASKPAVIQTFHNGRYQFVENIMP